MKMNGSVQSNCLLSTQDKMASNLEEAVCRGMDKFHQCSNLETFFELTKRLLPDKKFCLSTVLMSIRKPRVVEHFSPSFKEWLESGMGFRDPDWNTLQAQFAGKIKFLFTFRWQQ